MGRISEINSEKFHYIRLLSGEINRVVTGGTTLNYFGSANIRVIWQRPHDEESRDPHLSLRRAEPLESLFARQGGQFNVLSKS
jgi:hypothetical protein